LAKNQLDRSQDSHNYHYDSAQRFTKMERGTIGGTPSFYQGYTLDALANWSSFNNNGTTESRSHDVMNAITFRGATSLSHDLNGNLTNDGNQKYIWDELNRLVEVRDSGNNIICDYYYNANNLRVEKHHSGGAKEQFYYDGATVLVETNGSQTKVREYVNGEQYIDEVILVVNGSTYNYYMSDLRYCVTGFIDSTGAVVERARYDGYGKRTLLDATYTTITTANVDQSYGYTDIRHDDESGLQYYRARYFDNYLGRFINHDPLGYMDGLNLYRGYFINNGVDPSGLWKIEKEFSRGSREPYSGAVCSNKDTDTLANLAKSISGNEEDASELNFTGQIKKGTVINIENLLTSLEMHLRSEVQKSISGYTGKFPPNEVNDQTGGVPQNETTYSVGSNITPSDLPNFINNTGSIVYADCLGGMNIIFYNALVTVVGNLYGNSSLIPWDYPGLDANNTRYSDRGYFKNNSNYSSTRSVTGAAMQGQHVIAESNIETGGTFYGHGIGKGNTELEIKNLLMKAYNNPKEKIIVATPITIDQVPGWLNSSHSFLDVGKIGSDNFKKNNQ